MSELVEDLGAALRTQFSYEYREKRRTIDTEFEEIQEQAELTSGKGRQYCNHPHAETLAPVEGGHKTPSTASAAVPRLEKQPRSLRHHDGLSIQRLAQGFEQTPY